MPKGKEIVKAASAEKLAMLEGALLPEPGFESKPLPRLGLVSQDITRESRDPKTKRKVVEVVQEAGEFFMDIQDEEETEQADGTKKKEWQKTFLGQTIEVIFAFQRKQLKFYDGEVYTSSDVYDSNDEVIRLWKHGAEVDRGTPAELRARKIYQGFTAKGKPTSKLEEHAILFVLFRESEQDEYQLFQMNLRGTSLYAFRDYKKQNRAAAVLTRLDSEPKEQGTTKWNQMTFEMVRKVSDEEADRVIAEREEIQKTIEAIAAFRAAKMETDAAFEAHGKDSEEFDEGDLPFQSSKDTGTGRKALPAGRKK